MNHLDLSLPHSSCVLKWEKLSLAQVYFLLWPLCFLLNIKVIKEHSTADMRWGEKRREKRASVSLNSTQLKWSQYSTEDQKTSSQANRKQLQYQLAIIEFFFLLVIATRGATFSLFLSLSLHPLYAQCTWDAKLTKSEMSRSYTTPLVESRRREKKKLL